jgi:predicted glycogen debranching enzyme
MRPLPVQGGMGMVGLNVSSLDFDALLEREWLATNGLGGFASSTIPGLNTRKYHGLLVAALAPPGRRMVLLSRVEETVTDNGWPFALASNEYPAAIYPQGHQLLRAFAAEPYPRWGYQADEWTLEKSLRLVHGQNTVCLTYTLLAARRPVDLELRPLFALRPIHSLMYQWNGKLDAASASQGAASKQHHRVPPTVHTPEVFFAHDGRFDAHHASWYLNTIYRRETERGYSGLEDLWNPGIVRWTLVPGQSVHFVCSTDPIDLEHTLETLNSSATTGVQHVLTTRAVETPQDVFVRAAERFIPAPSAPAPMVSGFPWAPASGRDGLIALPGLLLVTGRFAEAKALLQSMAADLDNGLLPSEYPEDRSPPIYNGVDTSLWFIHAVWQYLRYSGDEQTAERLLDPVLEIIESYQHGAGLGIHADQEGLISSHAPGIGTTWMDARAGDWVVTPRAGKAVEINALWYNALSAAAELCEHAGRHARAEDLLRRAATVRESFNRRFWNADCGCCFDVIDDNRLDASIRPNQLLAISLPFAVLAPEHHAAVLETVHKQLLTPLGLRTLAPGEPNYHGRYGGDVVSRDRAYHQGSAFPWLLGPWVSAYVRVLGRSQSVRSDAMNFLQPCLDHINSNGLGQLCELFDGDPPHRGGGLIASAPAVGELLRCYVEDILDHTPAQLPSALKTPQLPLDVTPTKTAATKR